MDAYSSAMRPGFFQGKVVLDVGCGTGILSMLAAKAGAAKVIGVDASPKIIDTARVTVEANRLADRVRLVAGKIEDMSAADLGLGREEKVDIVLSEWMGYCLLFESMLPSVLSARDRFMDPRGTMFPNRCGLFIEAWSDRVVSSASRNSGSPSGSPSGSGRSRLEWWRSVQGLDLGPFAELAVKEVSVEVVRPSHVVTSRCRLWDSDLNTCKDSELDFEVPFEVTFKDGSEGGDSFWLDGFVVGFDVDFTESGASSGVKLCTGADRPPTHWKQSLFLLHPLKAPSSPLEGGSKVQGTFKLHRQSNNPRNYDATVSWQAGELIGEQKYAIST